MRLFINRLLYFCVATTAQAAPLSLLPLWPNEVPDALGSDDKDKPTLTAYLPKEQAEITSAILICPGGGYGMLAQHEGADFAQWLAEHGIAGIVLKYRLGSAGYHHPTMLNDAARGLRLVRSKAEDWKIDPRRISIMGSSAGGHLASTLLTHFDSGKTESGDPVERESSRPDFGILCYPVITMGPNTNQGSKRNLLGPNPVPELVDFLSSEKQVTKNTPPCFIWHTWEDDVVKVENSLDFASALRKSGVPFDLHIYQKGPHGIGLSRGQYGATEGQVHPWALDLLVWLRQNQWAK